MAHLVIMVGKKHERTIELDVPRLIIGRGDEAGLQLQNEVVSRQHCAVESEGTRHILVDLESTSGTFVGGERVKRAVTLQHGDRIELGKHTLVYERSTVEIQPVAASGGATGATNPESSSAGFWKAGLQESGFGAAETGGSPTGQEDAEGDKDAATESASNLKAPSEPSMEQYKGTLLASQDEMARIRATLELSSKPHLTVLHKGQRTIVPMKEDSISVGYYDGADFRLEGSRFFGRKQFSIFPSGEAYLVRVDSMFAKVFVAKQRAKGQTLLKDGAVIRAGGLKFKFGKGD